MKVLGIDEAGRGPVIGSMFVGGFMIENSENQKLRDMGVKDSKKLSGEKREAIADKLRGMGEPHVREVTATEIDDLREVMTLNEIEIQGFVDVIQNFELDKIIVDLPEPDGERFGRKLKSKLPERYQETKIIAEHGADDEYPVVSAASILAKSARESQVEELHRKYGYDFKSGYPHDQETRDFLAEYLKEKGEFPPETRESWSTADKVRKKADQSGLEDF